jgi:Contact-dependent growth inhibition CdiA C-terminal domain
MLIFVSNIEYMPNILLFESFDETLYIKDYFDKESHGFVVIHKTHGLNEVKGNKTIALILAKQGYRVVLQPNLQDMPTPDASINDEIWEFKTISQSINLSNTVQKDLKRGKRQSSKILIYITQTYKIPEITKGIYNAIKFDEGELIEEIAILFKNERLILLKRIEVLDKSFTAKFL